MSDVERDTDRASRRAKRFWSGSVSPAPLESEPVFPGHTHAHGRARPAADVMSTAAADASPPVAFNEFILKLASRCNLVCDYCYVYAAADQSWRTQPHLMSLSTLRQVGRRVSEHAARHALPRVKVIFHGGEPLLVGATRLHQAASALRDAMPEGVQLRLSIQTNGTLLDDAVLAVLAEHDVQVGVSLDGPPAQHDLHRRYPGGGATYPKVAEGLRRLGAPAYRHLFAGLLCVVDPRTDPVQVFEELVRHRPPRLDLLLPHATWRDRLRRDADPTYPAYGRWLARAFDTWFHPPGRATDVRLFAELMHLALGGASASDQIGLSPATHVVVETDGSIQQVDTLKIAFPGAPETGLDVVSHTFDDALLLPAVRDRQSGLAALSSRCRACPLVTLCGGGHYSHRYRDGTGFAHPSAYCADLQHLIQHVTATLARSMP